MPVTKPKFIATAAKKVLLMTGDSIHLSKKSKETEECGTAYRSNVGEQTVAHENAGEDYVSSDENTRPTQELKSLLGNQMSPPRTSSAVRGEVTPRSTAAPVSHRMGEGGNRSPPKRSEKDTMQRKIAKRIPLRSEAEALLHEESERAQSKGRSSHIQEETIVRCHKEIGKVHEDREERIQELEERVLQLEHEKGALEERSREYEKEWRKSADKLTRLTPPGVKHKVDDSDLAGEYMSIVYAAGVWAMNFCAFDKSRRFTSDNEWQCMKKLTPYYSMYAKSPQLKPILVQSYIMNALAEHVLSVSEEAGLLWAGSLSPGIRLLQKRLQPGAASRIPALLRNRSVRAADVKEYATWKAQTAILVANEKEGKEVSSIIGDHLLFMRSHLRPFVTSKSSSTWPDLRDIIRSAVILDEEIQKSRALFTFSRWVNDNDCPWDLSMDESKMETAAGLDPGRTGMNVELVVAPFMLKTGTADGDAYDTMSYLVKCVVVCTESRKKCPAS